MNIERLITMIINRLFRRLLNKGVDAGIDMAARRGKGGQAPAAGTKMTPEERERAQAAKEAAKRARQAAKLARRMR